MGVLLVDLADPVAVVTLNRPERRNALTGELMGALRRSMAELDADPAVRAIVLTGAGPAFCAGLDLQVLADPAGGLLGADGRAVDDGGGGHDDGDDGRGAAGDSPGAAGAGGFWAPLRTPVIGAVNGPAVTGGLEIALQCDVRIAGPSARFADTHARVGVMPGGGLTWRLPRAIGLQRALEMSLTGRFVGADEAAAWGLVSRVVAADALLDEALAMAAAVAELDPAAASAVLAMYHRAADLGFGAEAAAAELDAAGGWRRTHFDRAAVEQRRRAIVERGRRLAPGR